MISDKIRAHHVERKVLYIRQPSAHQVLHNRESSALQYAMRDRLTALGRSEIEVIDDDLGRSAAGGVQRTGFERMVAQVCLGKVGAVVAREVSRFARNSRDWQQLIEMCRVVDTVLIDQEAIYAPRHGNDRLLLGLKGSLNEYELDLLRQRSRAARYEKARRGELVVSVPVGYVKAGDRYEKDPDRRVQKAIELVFDKVARRRAAGSAPVPRAQSRAVAIIEYLAARYGPTVLAPQASEASFPSYLQYLHFGEASLAGPMTVVAYSWFMGPEDQKENPGVEAARTIFQSRLRAVEKRLEDQAFIAGSAFTAADISVVYALGFGQGLRAVGAYAPVVQEYLTRCRSRPPFRRALAK